MKFRNKIYSAFLFPFSIEKSCVHNRGSIFHRIFMKLCLIVCLKTIYVKLKYGSCGFENYGRLLDQIIEKTLCTQ